MIEAIAIILGVGALILFAAFCLYLVFLAKGMSQ